MLALQGVTYFHPNGNLLFSNIDFLLNKNDKAALIGNNGIGKSTFLSLLSGSMQPSKGTVIAGTMPYHVPQIFGQFNDHTVAEALKIDEKLTALSEILKGNATEATISLFDNDWAIEERCQEAFEYWQLGNVALNQKMHSLSGGQKTKVFLAGIMIHDREVALLDEPSNHLDTYTRRILYDFVVSTRKALLVVSHDRQLLNILDRVYELGSSGITAYGGNYDFYAHQKALEQESLDHQLKNKSKALRKAKETERASLERQRKLNANGKAKQEKAGMPIIMMNTLRNNAEKSTARLKDAHTEKVKMIASELTELRKALPVIDKMKWDLNGSKLHSGKIIVTATNINCDYGTGPLWKEGLTLQLRSGERIAINGSNGSGKTTLIKVLLGELNPTSGIIERVPVRAMFIDQDYSIINDGLTVYEHAAQFNPGVLHEHDIKIRLNRFLFGKEDWDKHCGALSGGEKMRLMLCLLTIGSQSPDLIVLDEPTNNLDLQNVGILTSALNEYKGTLLVVSHDSQFVKDISPSRSIEVARD